jgi:hypothetical protein
LDDTIERRIDFQHAQDAQLFYYKRECTTFTINAHDGDLTMMACQGAGWGMANRQKNSA